ncbi:MAG: CvpA family protein [Bacillota bacterium]|jgi:uncharacterized membrane protein required for colicin V production
MNMNWILAGLLLCGFVIGWRKGLFRIVSGLVGLIIQLYVAFHFNAPMGALIDRHTKFTHWMTSILSEHLPIVNLVSAFPVEFLSKVPHQTVDEFVNAPGYVISGLLLTIISFIVLFFLTKLFFSLVIRVITKCLDHTLIGPLNRLLGGVLGLFFVALIMGVGLLGLSGILGEWDLPGANLGSINQLLNQSDLAGFLLDLF